MRLLLLAISTISFLSLSAQDRVNGATFQTRSPVLAEHGMVCTSHPLASQIGLDILKQGGNAIDAAIAANAALGLMEPTGCGVGGDLFAIVWDAKTQKLYGLNGSGRSPKSMTLDTLKAMGLEKIPAYGPLPVSVPGAVDGWTSLHDKFGSMPLKKILAPAIGYAEEGFPVTELIGYYLGSIDRFSRMGYPNIKETYYDPNGGERPKNGDRYRNPALADTYRAIAKKGREGFYEGEVAQTITTFIKEQGGFLSLEDLSAHHSQWVEPVSVNYRGYDVWELPPNGQGIAALQLLNILENKDFSEVRWGSEEHLHLFTEAKKRVFEDRAKYYADIDMAEVPVEALLSKEYAAENFNELKPYASTSPEVVRANLTGILDELQKAQVVLLVVGTHAPNNYGPDYKQQFDQIFPELAEEYGALFIPSFFEPFFTDGQLNESASQYFQPDGIHPNAEGVKIVIESIAPVFLKFVAQASSG